MKEESYEGGKGRDSGAEGGWDKRKKAGERCGGMKVEERTYGDWKSGEGKRKK